MQEEKGKLMYCPYCGNPLEEGVSRCTHCGSELSKKNQISEKRVAVTMPEKKTVTKKKSNSIFAYITMGLAILECIIPFLCWAKIPLYNSISSFLGGGNDVSNCSLFGFIGMISLIGTSAGVEFNSVYVLAGVGILILIAVFQIIFNVIFILKAIGRNKFRYRYTVMASVLLLLIATLFLLIMGSIAAALQVIKVSFAPWLAVVVSIANFVFATRARLEEKT